MEDQNTIDYYVNLLISQYSQKPKAKATIEALIQNTGPGRLLNDISEAFQIDSARGAQLDILARYFNAPRTFVKDGQTVRLTDADVRILISILIVKNQMGNSLYEIQKLLLDFFGEDLMVTDHQDMSLTYSGSSPILDQRLVDFLKNSDFLPRPTGVRIRDIDIDTTTKYYGWRYFQKENPYVRGMNEYDHYDMMAPWLTYTSTIPSMDIAPPSGIQEHYGFRRYTINNPSVYGFNSYTNYDGNRNWLRYGTA